VLTYVDFALRVAAGLVLGVYVLCIAYVALEALFGAMREREQRRRMRL
jgi:hypothetical protein